MLVEQIKSLRASYYYMRKYIPASSTFPNNTISGFQDFTLQLFIQ